MIVFLHGFLGLPADWNDVIAALPPEAWSECCAIDLWRLLGTHPKPLLLNENLGRELLAVIRAQAPEAAKSGSMASPLHLVGYSMGARLALQLASEFPWAISTLTLISAHPGLTSLSEQKARLRSDSQWASRFLSEPWEPLIGVWNQQSVFSVDPREKAPPVRRESEFQRSLLSRALNEWSLGRLTPGLRPWEEIDFPTSVLVGTEDEKFLKLGEIWAARSPKIQLRKLGGGHRLLFDAPDAVAQAIIRVL